jgi:acetylornithine/N-succinyldiaminopimelate aminotransferase
VVHTCHTLGLLVNAPRLHCLRFMPALNLSEEELKHGFSILRKGIAAALGHSLYAAVATDAKVSA